MVGIVLCSHASLAQGLKEAGEMLAGEQVMFEAITFDGNEELLDLGERIKAVSSEFESCIYLCDILNGTPFNACALAIAGTDNYIVSGMSLPLVIELLIARNNTTDLKEMVDTVIENSNYYVQKRISSDIFG